MNLKLGKRKKNELKNTHKSISFDRTGPKHSRSGVTWVSVTWPIRHLTLPYPINKTQLLTEPSLISTVGCPFSVFTQIQFVKLL